MKKKLSHFDQLSIFFNILNSYRYLIIRGFLKLPITADTDLDIVIHHDDFKEVCDKMNLVSINKTFKHKIINNCIYEPCKTIGSYDKTMANGCFRVDLYNDFFFHYGKYKYQIPHHIIDILFESKSFLIKNTNINIKIPKSEVEIVLLLLRAIIDKNGKQIQTKHLKRINDLYSEGINNNFLISLINMCAVYDSKGLLIKSLNNSYLIKSPINNILKLKNTDHLNEDNIFYSNKIKLENLVTCQFINKINEYYNLIPIKSCNEYKYVKTNIDYNFYWNNYSKSKFNKLINSFDGYMKNNFNHKSDSVKICQDYRTIYKNVWYSPYIMKYIAYIYINGKCNILGKFNTPIDAAKIYDKKALEFHNYTAVLNFKNNKKTQISSVIERQNGLFQIRDGIHRCSLASIKKYSTFPVNFCFNLGKRPKDLFLPLEKEFHSFLFWLYDDIKSIKLEKKLKNKLSKINGIEINEEIILNIEKEKRFNFVNDIYRLERKFYNFSGDVPKSDLIIKSNSKLKIIIFTDYYPLYFDNIKQNKNLPVNKKIKDIKVDLRKEYKCNFLHCSDNCSEHDQVILAIMKYNCVSDCIDLKKYLNILH